MQHMLDIYIWNNKVLLTSVGLIQIAQIEIQGTLGQA